MKYFKTLSILVLFFLIIGADTLEKDQLRTFLQQQSFGTSNSTDVAWADLNEDDLLDVFVTNESAPDQIWLASPSGILTLADQDAEQAGIQGLGNSAGRSLAVADFDQDGDLDAVVANYKQPNTWWKNDGAGHFSEYYDFNGTVWNTQNVLVTDFNQDSWPDVFFCNGKDKDEIWTNTGLRTFVVHQSLTAGASRGAAVGDFNEDTLPDVVVVHYNQENQVWLQETNGTFSKGPTLGEEYNASSSAVASGDLDGDGDLDLVVANYFSQPNRVYRNHGLDNDASLLFEEIDQDVSQEGMQGFGQSRSRDLRLFDADKDGDLDCFVVNSADEKLKGANRLWVNNGEGRFTDSGLRIGSSFSYGLDARDINADNATDVVVANYENQANQVWINQAALFAEHSAWVEDKTTAQKTKGIALADIAGNGAMDVFVVNQGQNQIFVNKGNGIFEDQPHQTFGAMENSTDVVLGDIDQNGHLDAVIGNLNDSSQVWMQTDGQFAQGQDLNASCNGLALDDLNGDGWLDLVMAKSQGNAVFLYRNGTFQNPNQTLGNANSTAVALGDIDGDGDIDACFSNNGSNSTVWSNDGNGTFTRYQTLPETANSTDVALGDLFGQGNLDIAICNYGQGNTVWKNANGTLTLSQSGLGSGDSTSLALADLDMDDDLDIVVGNDNNQGVRLWTNDGTGFFQENAQALGQFSCGDIGVEDLDGDTDLDIFMGNMSPNAVWLNQEAEPSAGGGGGGGCS